MICDEIQTVIYFHISKYLLYVFYRVYVERVNCFVANMRMYDQILSFWGKLYLEEVSHGRSLIV